jgi:hypothetical protein
MLHFLQIAGPLVLPQIVLAAVVALLALVNAVRIRGVCVEDAASRGRRIDAVLFWGCLAAILGFLGQWNGLFKAANAIFGAGMVNPKLVVTGLAESLTTSVFGMFVLVASLFLWFPLRVALDRQLRRLDPAGRLVSQH